MYQTLPGLYRESAVRNTQPEHSVRVRHALARNLHAGSQLPQHFLSAHYSRTK